MLNEPLPIMDKQRILEIQEKPRLKYIKNEEEYMLHHNTAYEKFNRGNQNTNRNFSLMNFTIENTSTIGGNAKVQQQNSKQQQSTSPTKSQKKQNTRVKQTGQRQLMQQQNTQEEQQQKDKHVLNNQNQWNGEELQWGEQDYQKDHECALDTQTNRCKSCGSVMKYIYHTGDTLIQKPFSIYYVDYYKTFSRKMDCHTLPKSKQKEFLIISYLPYMREWTYFILDRQRYLGLEELIFENNCNQLLSQSQFLSARGVSQQGTPLRDNRSKISKPNHQHHHSQGQPQSQIKLSQKLPFSLGLQFPQVKPDRINSKFRSQSLHQSQIQSSGCVDLGQDQQFAGTDFLSGREDITFDFETFTVLGNYESSNINFCTVDKKETKCQILLRSDTNTKGCLHWFMFTIKVNQLFRPKKNIKHVASNLTIQEQPQQQSNNDQDLQDQSFDKKWIVMDDDEEEEDIHDENQSKTISFSILNNKRNGYLYREGMQIAIFDSTKQDKGWHRGGDNIFYYRSNVDHQFFQAAGGDNKNQTRASFSTNVNGNTAGVSANNQNNQQTNILNNNGGQSIVQSSTQPNINQQLQQTLIQPQIQPNSKRGFQTMDFNFTFTENGQRVTFAYCYPYTLTDLTQYLESQEQKLICSFLEYQNLDKDKQQLIIKTNKVLYKKKTIASSRIGLPIILLKITSSKNPKLTKNRKKKKVIFIIARQHPGETPSSFACEGFITYLLQDTIQAKYLLENYIFKIVPMMNPDGVVIGNSRCNLAGSDLNRKWDNPDPILHPEVFQVKKEIKKSHLKREVAIFCDLHGHSMKKHAFFYGCNKASDGGASTWTQVRLIPRILSKKCHLFSIKDCKFRVTEDKKNTARVICWNELKISNSFTLETSFFGYDDIQNDNKPTHFTIQDFLNLGKNLCESILEYTLVMDILMAELVESKGWLKPYRLVQVTGESAQNKMIRNMKDQKKQDKLKRIEANINNMQLEKEKQQALIQQQIRQKDKRCVTPTQLNGRKANTSSNMQGDSRSKSYLSSEDRSRKGQQYLEDDIGADGGGTKEDTEMDLLLQLCPGMKKDWRDYFGKEELEKNFKKIDRGEDPNDQESVSGSDSEAEIDIFKENELLLSNEAKNRKKQKKKKQQVKKEKESNTTTIDAKANREADYNNQIDLTKTKKPSTAYSQSLERNRWNPSPLIQNYKQQLEMKKQQLKKQSYPIAKVGQSFSSAYQTPSQDNPANSAAAQQQSQQSSPLQQTKGQVAQYSPQIFNQPATSSNLAKNSVNGAYLEKKLIEMQQVQSNQQGQNQGNVNFYSRNSQAMIYQSNGTSRHRKSVMSQFEDNKQGNNVKGISSSNSEMNSAFRLNTSDMQSRLNENQNMPNSNSSAGNYGKYSTSNSTQSSNLVQQTQISTRKYFYQSNQDDNPLQETDIISEVSSINKDKSDQNQYQRQNRAHSISINNNKMRNSRTFAVDDDDNEEQAMSKYKNSIGIIDSQHKPSSCTPNQRCVHKRMSDQVQDDGQEKYQILNYSYKRTNNGSRNLKNADEIENVEVQVLSQKNNKQQQQQQQLQQQIHNSAGNVSNQQVKMLYGSYTDLKKRHPNSEIKGNTNNLSIPHNFVSASSSKQELQPFYFEEQVQTNSANMNQNFSSSNSDIVNNEDFNQQLNNIDQTTFTKEIAKNASNFDKKIRAQAPLRQLINPDKQSQYSQGNATSFNNMNGVNNAGATQLNYNINFIRHSDRIGALQYNSAINNNNNSLITYENKNIGKKYRARSIQEGKNQQQYHQLTTSNNQITNSSNYEKINTASDEQKLQMYLQENGHTFMPFKNFSQYGQQLQMSQNPNNIRIRKLNFI